MAAPTWNSDIMESTMTAGATRWKNPKQ